MHTSKNPKAPAAFYRSGGLAAVMLLAQFLTHVQSQTVDIKAPEVPLQEISPLPAPTEKMLRRGDGVLGKIAFVGKNISLTQFQLVLAEFGFNEITSTAYPTTLLSQPRGPKGTIAKAEDLRGSGFTEISVNPWIDSSGVDFSARLSGKFDIETVCVSVDAVRKQFGSSAREISSLVVDIHPVLRPPSVNDIGHLLFKSAPAPGVATASVSFTFDYQACAKSFSYAYIKTN
jgi:hypothetical protein